MGLLDWLRGAFHAGGYDRQGNVKYLLGRANDPKMCEVEGVPATVRDEALGMLCESFDIPERQKYCLRPDDPLIAIYESFLRPGWGDDMEFERLERDLDELPGPPLTPEEAAAIRTVADVVRLVASRRSVS